MHLCNKMNPDISEQSNADGTYRAQIRVLSLFPGEEKQLGLTNEPNNGSLFTKQCMRKCAAAIQKYSIPYYIQGLAGLSSRQGQGVAVDEDKVLVVEV